MIGFNALGRLGRFANQMFQYASLKGIARNVGAEICIPKYTESVNDGIGNMLRTELFDSFDLSVRQGLLGNGNAPTVRERFFHFDEQLFNSCPDDISLHGFFQTEKYFKHIESEIREDFTFKNEVLEPCTEMMAQLNSPIALHVRRGDYIINSGNHPPCSIEYYRTALEKFDKDREVLIFSDDPKWCKENELFSDDRFLISDTDDNRIDMCLMSMCSDFIIANSSFSWWGAWLANRGTVIAPKKWFGVNLNHDTKDLIPDKWEVI